MPFLDSKKTYYESLFSFFHGVGSREDVKEKISKYIPLLPSKFGDLLNKYTPLRNHFKQENRPDLLRLWKKLAEVSPKVCLLVAESGMGKTLVFQKVFVELAKKYPAYHLAFVYCGSDTDQRIAQVKEQSRGKEQETIIFIDAFDEDYKARTQDYTARFRELILGLQNFKKVFISARIQLFERDAQVPTQIAKMTFLRVEIGKMNKKSIESFIAAQFPDKAKQAKALAIVKGKEESLFYRPLILTYLDFLFTTEKPFYFLAQIYAQIVKEWAERESKVLNQNEITQEGLSKTENRLKQDAQWLAKNLYEKGQDGWQADELKTLSQIKKDALSRSFFTRNEKDDKYSFAHKAFYDYFLVLNLLDSSIREEGFVEKPSNADTVQLYQEILTEKTDSTRKKVIHFLNNTSGILIRSYMSFCCLFLT
ncbi:NACHT domain-containing protein [Thermoflexibacter ruber]|nr:AAA family ATPase [Thermoflexibacter ruber]